MGKIIILFLLILLTFNGGVFASPSIEAYPFNEYKPMSASFGEYRIFKNWHYKHEGVDLAVPLGENVYPVESGTFLVSGFNNAYGNYVVIKHSGYQTLYAHLSAVESFADDAPVDRNTLLGKSGSTGNSTGPHLHLSKALQQASQFNSTTHYQLNPLKDVLAQPKNGTGVSDDNIGNAFFVAYKANLKVSHPRIIFLDDTTGEEINSFQSDLESVLDPDSFEIHPIKIVVEAYQYRSKVYDAKLKKYYYKGTNPYRVKFSITKNGQLVSNNPEDIVFDDMSVSYDQDYHIVDEKSSYGAKPFSAANYFYRTWTPSEAGLYSVSVEVYPIHKDNKGVSPTDYASRSISIGINGVGLDYYDENVGLAYNPDTGLSLASASGADISIYPRIYYTDISSQIFTPYPDTDGFSDHTMFSARSNIESDWEIHIKDDDGDIVKTLDGGTGYETKTEWEGNISSGKYTYQVQATGVNLGQGVSTMEGSTVIIDKDKPAISDGPSYVSSSMSSITATGESSSIVFSPDEDLSYVVVNVYNSKTYEKVVDHLDVLNGLEKGGQMTINWEDAGTYPNGWYYFQIVMTDLAGNVTAYDAWETKIKIDKPGEPSAGEEPTTTPAMRIEPEDWVKNLAVGDIAMDSSGNFYVVYTNEHKIIKYNNKWEELAVIDHYNADTLWYPMSVAVSFTDGSVYVADTHAQRIFAFNSDLSPKARLGGRDVYQYVKTHHYYYYWPVVHFREVRGGHRDYG